MRISPEKQVQLAQMIAKRVEALAKAGELKTSATEVKLRQRALDTIRAFVKRDDQCAEAAKTKIRSIKRDIPEGSAEWETMFRQFYDQELDRLRKVMK